MTEHRQTKEGNWNLPNVVEYEVGHEEHVFDVDRHYTRTHEITSVSFVYVVTLFVICISPFAPVSVGLGQKWVVAQAQQLCWRLVARCRWPLGHRVFLMHAMRRGAHAGAVRGGPWAPLPFSQFL